MSFHVALLSSSSSNKFKEFNLKTIEVLANIEEKPKFKLAFVEKLFESK